MSTKEPVTINRHGALLYRGKMIARIVYADDGLREALRASAEEHMHAKDLPKKCEYCGCDLAVYLGQLEYHVGDCPNIPF